MTTEIQTIDVRTIVKAEMVGTFQWDYLEQGPEVWKVRIARRECCGCNCQGAS